MIQVSAILSDVWTLLGESSDDTNHEEAELLSHLNRVVKDVAGRVAIFRQSYDITGPGDENQEHDLPEWFNRVEFVYDGDRLVRPVAPDARFIFTYGPDLTADRTNHTRGGYWISGKKIGFDPALTASDTRTLVYWELPDDLSADDELDAPEYFAEVLVNGVLMWCYRKERDPLADTYFQQYEASLRKARGNLNLMQYGNIKHKRRA